MSTVVDRVRLVKYSLLQLTLGPSLACDLLVFIYFFRHWREELLAASHHHVILCLLVVSFIQKSTDILFHLYYLRWGTVLVFTDEFCAIWNWLDYSLYCMSLDLVTWCCIERHLFVFHSQLMKKKLCLVLFHYVPLAVCLLYTPAFYARFIFLPDSCVNTWDYTMVYCGGPCYLYTDRTLGTFDWLFHCGTPVVLIFGSNVLLFCRIVWQKVKVQRRIKWVRQRRLITQLTFVSILFLMLASPAVIVGCVQLLWSPTFLSDVQNDYFYYVGCFINQLLPFVIVSSLPKLHQSIRLSLGQVKARLYSHARVQPVAIVTTNNAVDEMTLHRQGQLPLKARQLR